MSALVGLLDMVRPLPGTPSGEWRLAAAEPALPAILQPGGPSGGWFNLLGMRQTFVGDARWRPGDAPVEWRRRLHGFGWIWALAPGDALDLMLDWIDANPAERSPEWGLGASCARIAEWIEWLRANGDVPEYARARVVHSLVHQAAVIEAAAPRPERGEEGLEQAIALVWAGAALSGRFSERWLERGLEMLERRLREQVFTDGGHASGSPLVQAELAQALLRLAASAGAQAHWRAQRAAAAARAAGERMVQALALLAHPDGEPALLDDCVLGVAPTAACLIERFGLSPAAAGAAWRLPDAGRVGVRGEGSVLLLDAGSDRHADALGFELSHRGRRLITDSGAPLGGDARAAAAAAHSTIEVDGHELLRATESAAGVEDIGDAVAIEGECAARLDRKRVLRHRRRMQVGAGRVDVLDVLTAPDSHRAVMRLHLAPGVEPRVAGDRAELFAEERRVAVAWFPGFEWRVEETAYHATPFTEQRRACLVAELAFLGEAQLPWSIELE